jgi:rhodanese-related sulfurtransferase
MFGSLLGRMMGAGPSASFDEVKAASQTGAAHIVDVREPGEFSAGHIPGSVNLPLSRFDPARLPKGKPVILICLSGARSASAKRACAAVDGVSHYGPGIAGWRNHGGALVR